MTKYRNFNPITDFPATFVDALQEFMSAGAFNLQLKKQSANVVRIPAGPGNAKVGVGIFTATAPADGVAGWRWREANLDLNHPATAAGVYDIFVTTASANAFHETGGGEVDDTNYVFSGVILAQGTTPSGGGIVAYRKVGETTWDGDSITELRQTVGERTGMSCEWVPATNLTPRKTIDADAVTLHELADYVGTLVEALRGQGIIVN